MTQATPLTDRPALSMSMFANQADYWLAMYEQSEQEAHELSEEIIRLRAMLAASPAAPTAPLPLSIPDVHAAIREAAGVNACDGGQKNG